MRSIGVRLTALYALSATATLACLFVIGYRLLETQLIHGLDLLNAAEFEQVRAHLGNEDLLLTPALIDERLRETTEYASVLFYINLQDRITRGLFRSSNLNGAVIPDVPGEHVYNAEMPDIGELRVGEYIMKSFDVVIATPLKQVREVMKGYVQVCIALAIGMLIASTAIGFGLSRVLLRPLRLIQETANHIRSDNLSERIPVAQTRDEISDLAQLLNKMFDRLESSFNQIRQFTAQASHELKTPLALIRLHAEKMIVDGSLPHELQEAVHVQLEELARLNRIIDELLLLSRAEAQAVKINLQPRDPAQFLQAFQQDAVVLAEYHGRRFEYTHRGEGTAGFDDKWISQVLLNLLTNAIRASPDGGRITLQSVLNGDIWRVEVLDRGSGLSAAQREQMFDRFVRFNAGADEQGCGLGLTICRSIIGLHRGRIYAEEGPDGCGLRVIFEI
jgi:signal transduction histidine kinase